MSDKALRKTVILTVIGLLHACGGGGGGCTDKLFTPDPSGPCDRIDPKAAYLWSIDASFTLAQLTEFDSPSSTWVAVLHVGETAELTVKVTTVTWAKCSHLITAVTWGTSGTSVATAQPTDRNTAVLTALTPGEVTVSAQASFEGGSVDVPYMFASGPYRIRRVRITP